MPKVSIIVPAYNAEKLLPDTVASVISQSFRDWELLIVNDGSADSTPLLAQKFAADDNRIKLINRENGGLSAARNSGIDAASGEYISFLDADDIWHKDFLSILVKVADESGADISAATFFEFENSSDSMPDYSKLNVDAIPHFLFSAVEAYSMVLYQTPPRKFSKRLDSSAWGKLYVRKIFDENRFTEGIWYEDLDFCSRVFPSSNKIVFLPIALYGYRQHPASFLHTFSLSRLDVLDVTDNIYNSISNLKFPLDVRLALQSAARTRRFAAHYNMIILLLNNNVKDKSLIRRCLDVIRDSRSEVLYNALARKKDRLGALLAYLPAPILCALLKLKSQD